MSNAETALQYHERAWLRYQERIAAHILCELPVEEAHLVAQRHHQEEYLKLQCSELLHELTHNLRRTPDS